MVQVVGEISTLLLLYFLYSEHMGRKRVREDSEEEEVAARRHLSSS